MDFGNLQELLRGKGKSEVLHRRLYREKIREDIPRDNLELSNKSIKRG